MFGGLLVFLLPLPAWTSAPLARMNDACAAGPGFHRATHVVVLPGHMLRMPWVSVIVTVLLVVLGIGGHVMGIGAHVIITILVILTVLMICICGGACAKIWLKALASAVCSSCLPVVLLPAV